MSEEPSRHPNSGAYLHRVVAGEERRSAERLALARLHRWGGDRLVAEMVELYLDQMPGRIDAGRAAGLRRDPSGLAHAAHSMRSSSAQLGASALAAACDVMETAAQALDVEGAVAALADVEAEYAALRDWLRDVTDVATSDATDPPPG